MKEGFIMAEYTKEQILKDVEELKNGKFSNSKITLDWMDSYVAYFREDKVDEYAAKCASIPVKIRKIEKEGSKDKGKQIEYKDVKGVREYFLETFFYDQSEKGKKEAKLKKQQEREQAKLKKEQEKNMSPEEKIKAKLKAIQDKNK